MLIQEIKTDLNSFESYLLFKDQPYSFFLDSGRDPDSLGRYSFIGADPLLVFTSKENDITVKTKMETKTVTGDPFAELQKLLKQYKMDYPSPFPFIGGAVGYFGYDLCHHLEAFPRTAVDDVNIPDCFMGFYDGIVIVDHKENKTYVAALGIEENEADIVSRLTAKFAGDPKVAIRSDFKINENLEFRGNFTKPEYLKALDAVHEYILAGDIYQTNLTQRFNADLQITPLELYSELRKINPAPFASYIDFGEGQIVSSSP